MRYIILLLLIVGCGSKKTVTTEKERIFIQETVTLPTSNELSISNLCDTLTLKAKDFKTSVNSGGIDTQIEIKGNKLTVKSETPKTICKDSIVFKDKFVEITLPPKKEHHYKLAVWCFIIAGLLGWFKNLWLPLVGKLFL
jgi:hypothetical protein